MSVTIEDIAQVRADSPEKIMEALEFRAPATTLEPGQKHLIIALDHPARGALGAGSKSLAMANRQEALERCVAALGRPGVTGFLGTADFIEDLALLGALDGKYVYGSMNRGGLQGSVFEMDDKFTCYDAETIVAHKLDGGKTLTRIDLGDPATVDTLKATAQAINSMAEVKKPIMVEPFISRRVDGQVSNDLSPEAVIKSITIASGLGVTSAYTWLKLPCVEQMERVMAATTLPSLILGGEVAKDPQAAFDGWGKALNLPNVYGLVIGRSLLYPTGDDVEKAVDQAVELL
ncbi:Cgl0159 family (beta/alpha)8-fold protein [Arcanobacterium ihumii]|uniref:Cgl0159 family (beta/alpha)8-fold protein n=1 Tax=Arcanobacterium ihumii TaxID=2138162 RepID=UPI000F53D735|nr:deoxyribose-phosphate aldolase [Arcanobacterium ihumii]